MAATTVFIEQSYSQYHILFNNYPNILGLISVIMSNSK